MRGLILCCALCGLAMAEVASAAVSEAEVEALRAQIQALSERLSELEAQNQAGTAVREDVEEVKTQVAATSWAERIRFKGDFRYRHEMIDEEGLESRTRQRIRARLGMTADVTDDVEVGLQLASGDDDPVSTNQTLGDGGSTKPINLDLAYFDWTLPMAGLHLLGGKFKSPLRRVGGHGLIWDSDWNPEGFGVRYDDGRLFGSAIGVWSEERSTQSDSLIFGGQLGWKTALGDRMDLTVGAGYYDIGNAQGETPFFDGDPRGNSVDANGNYLFDFEELELFAELGTEIGGVPLSLFADYVKNLDAGEFDTGYAIGASWGPTRGARPWGVRYAYEDLEADAVLALTTESDFGGGRTDAKGHVFRASYGLTTRQTLNFTYFLNEIGEAEGNKRDFDRLQLDLSFKY